MRVLILGGGPTGLGAAWRLQELEHSDWLLLERSGRFGGLASSPRDAAGFVWDIGAHVPFSRYEYYDRTMSELLAPDEWIHHDRGSWTWAGDRFIPFPFHRNIHLLPPSVVERCVWGLIKARSREEAPARNFEDLVRSEMGSGIAEALALPYYRKVWAYPLDQLNTSWIGRRLRPPNLLADILHQITHRDATQPKSDYSFRYPRSGGIGAIWNACGARLPANHLRLSADVRAIDLPQRRVRLRNGAVESYDCLISTLPLIELVRLTGQAQLEQIATKGLWHSSSNVVGLGLRGRMPDALVDKFWLYFPDETHPFYRASVFSNFAPSNVPDPAIHWSIMFEVAESPVRPVAAETLARRVIDSARSLRLLSNNDEIVSQWQYRADYGYPTPCLDRDEALAQILRHFESHGVYSRGRFGAWKFEVSNQDHSFMQGVEAVDRILLGWPEMTVSDTERALSGRHPINRYSLESNLNQFRPVEPQ